MGGEVDNAGWVVDSPLRSPMREQSRVLRVLCGVHQWEGGVQGFACALGEGITGDPTAPSPGQGSGHLCLFCTPPPLLASSGALMRR